MILMHYKVWFGPSKNNPHPEITQTMIDVRTYVSRLPLGQAVRLVKDYENAYNRKYSDVTAIDLTLLTVSQIDDLTDDEIGMITSELVERMETL